MKKFKAAIKALLMTKWFIVASWKYIVTKKLNSKIEFFIGLPKAWCLFMIATYSDIFACTK